MTDLADRLQKVDLFADLPVARRDWIAHQCVWKTVEPGTRVFSQGDKTDGVFFLIKGTVRALVSSASGKNVVFQDMHAGRMFGEISAIDGSERSASIETQTSCLIASLSPGAFADVLRKEPEISLEVIRIMAGEIRRLSLRVIEFSTRSVQRRVHAELFRLAGGTDSGDLKRTITPAPKLADIAEKISTHREAVSRELSRLTKNGLLERTSQGLHITDLVKLERLANEEIED